MNNLTYSLLALGCKANQYDAQTVGEALRRNGFESVSHKTAADIVLIVTCCITTTAMRKSRQAIRKSVRQNPNAAVAIFGCYCDYDTARIEQMLDDLGIEPKRRLIAGHHHPDWMEKLHRLTCSNNVGAGRGGSSTSSRGERPVCGNERSMNAGKTTCQTPLQDVPSIKANRLRAVKRNVPATGSLPRCRNSEIISEPS